MQHTLNIRDRSILIIRPDCVWAGMGTRRQWPRPRRDHG